MLINNNRIKNNIISYLIVSAILFEDAILLGAENDTLLYTSDTTSVFSLPFCQVERTVHYNIIYFILIQYL